MIWLLTNWRLVAGGGVVLLLVAALAYANHAGHVSERRQCEAEAQEAKDALQKQFDAKAKEYESDKAKRERTMTDIRRRLANEKAKNTAYATCHAGAEFLSIYREVAAGNASEPR